jgi:hypothetical protein
MRPSESVIGLGIFGGGGSFGIGKSWCAIFKLHGEYGLAHAQL